MRLKVPYLAAALVVGAVSSAVLAQPRPAARPAAPAARPGAPAARPAAPAARPGAPARPAPGRPATPAAHVDGGAHADATAAATGDGGAAAAAMDGGANVTAAAVDTDAGTVTVNDASLPMRQVGSGTVLHFPVPEQFVRTAVPVFVQVRSSAPIDHVSLFFRGLGARRYTEVRMQAMGQQFRLASGYGAMIPCEDVFPPKAQYYVEAYDSSGEPNGRAGTADTPIEVSVVEQRHYPAPTLPGQPPPQTCGTLTVAATSRDAGVRDAEPERGSADLGEPCQVTNDCRRGLRCGSNHQCVFDR